MPELVLAAVVAEESNVPEAVAAALRDRGPRWRATQIALFVKWHHLDEHGTVEAFPLGQLDARPLELGAPDYVRRQIRETLVVEKEAISYALTGQGFDTTAAGVAALPLEIDIQSQLARQLTERQPRVSDVTPPSTTVAGDTGD